MGGKAADLGRDVPGGGWRRTGVPCDRANQAADTPLAGEQRIWEGTRRGETPAPDHLTGDYPSFLAAFAT